MAYGRIQTTVQKCKKVQDKSCSMRIEHCWLHCHAADHFNVTSCNFGPSASEWTRDKRYDENWRSPKDLGGSGADYFSWCLIKRVLMDCVPWGFVVRGIS